MSKAGKTPETNAKEPLQNSLIGVHTESLSHGAEYFWHPFLVLIMERRNYVLLKSKVCVEWKGIPWRLCFMAVLCYGSWNLCTYYFTPSIKFTLHWTQILLWIVSGKKCIESYELKTKWCFMLCRVTGYVTISEIQEGLELTWFLPMCYSTFCIGEIAHTQTHAMYIIYVSLTI